MTDLFTEANVCPLTSPFDLTWSQSYLLNEVTLEHCVFAHLVRKRDGQDVGQPLRLMDDGVREGQVLSVLQLNLTTSDDPVQLLLDPVWRVYWDLLGSRRCVWICLITASLYLAFQDTWP